MLVVVHIPVTLANILGLQTKIIIRFLNSAIILLYLLSSNLKPPKKAFSVDKLLACCSAAPDPSQEYKLLVVLAVECEV